MNSLITNEGAWSFYHDYWILAFSGYITDMVLKNNTVNWVDSAKYLGITFRGGASLIFDYADITRKFYVACNSVLGCCKCADECVKLSLVKSWKDCFRRIFNYNRWESVHDLQYCCRLRPMLDMYSFYRDIFLSTSVCLSPVVRRVKVCCNLLTVACCDSFIAFLLLFELFLGFCLRGE